MLVFDTVLKLLLLLIIMLLASLICLFESLLFVVVLLFEWFFRCVRFVGEMRVFGWRRIAIIDANFKTIMKKSPEEDATKQLHLKF